MDRITKIKVKTIIKYWDRIETASKSNYMRCILQKDIKLIDAEYRTISNTNMVVNSTCPACVMDLLKRVYNYINNNKRWLDVIMKQVKKESILLQEKSQKD